MTRHDAFPTYAQLRGAIDRLYPECSGAIAVNRHGRLGNIGGVMDDLRAQIDPALQDKVALEAIETSLLWTTRHMRADTHIAFHCARSENMAGDAAAYIFMDQSAFTPRRAMRFVSSGEVSPLRLRFNQAAMRRDILAWSSFYHELCHGLLAVKRHKMPVNSDADALAEEALCDTFSAIHTLRQFGAGAVPVLKTLADMRLSCLPARGPEYFTAPAIRAVLNLYQSGGLKDADTDTVFAMALDITKRNRMPMKMEYEMVNLRYGSVFDARRFKGGERVWRDAIRNVVVENEPDGGPITQLFAEAADVLRREYRHKTVFFAVYDRAKRAVFG